MSLQNGEHYRVNESEDRLTEKTQPEEEKKTEQENEQNIKPVGQHEKVCHTCN